LQAAEPHCPHQQQAVKQAGQLCKQTEAAVQISIQVTTILRNLAVSSSNANVFAQHHGGVVLDMLLKLASVCAGEAELLLTISRCFSKLSLQQSCRISMLRMSTAELHSRTFSTVDFASGQAVLNQAQQQQQQQDSRVLGSDGSQLAIVNLMLPWLLQPHNSLAADTKIRSFLLRVAFTLCNLTSHHVEARQALVASPGALQGLLQLLGELLRLSQQERQAAQQGEQQLDLEHCMGEQQGLHSNQFAAPAAGPTAQEIMQYIHSSEQPRQPDVITDAGTHLVCQAAAKNATVPVEELLVKIVRLIANAAVDQEVAGPMLCSSPHMLTYVVQLLQAFSYEEHEELVLNTVAAVSNLAFYNSSPNQLRQLQEPGILLKPLLALLTSGSEEAVIEAARAIANLTTGPTPARVQLLSLNPSATCTQPGSAAQEDQLTDSNCSRCIGHYSPPAEIGMVASATAAAPTEHIQGAAQAQVGPLVLEALLLLLNHRSWAVVCSVAGALLNLSAAETSAAAFKKVSIPAGQ
jgi:hypothetical protein